MTYSKRATMLVMVLGALSAAVVAMTPMAGVDRPERGLAFAPGPEGRAGGLTPARSSAGDVRFEALDIYIDSGEVPLAAWQVKLEDRFGTMMIVGIEGGEHPAFRDPAFYDPEAMMRERVILAAFNTSDADALPRGRTRVATVHVQVSGDASLQLRYELTVAATVGGELVTDADISIDTGVQR